MLTPLLLAATVRSFAHMPLGTSDRNSIMTLTQQWRYLNFTRNSFYILFPEQGII